MDTSIYSDNPDRLLTEIGFAGAQYGLYLPVMAIATHLGKNDKTRAPSILILGVLNIAMKNYDGARTIFSALLEVKDYEKFFPEAKSLLEIVDQISPPKKFDPKARAFTTASAK